MSPNINLLLSMSSQERIKQRNFGIFTAANFSRKPPLLPHISVVTFHLNLWRHAPTRSHCFYPWSLRLAGQGMAKIRLEKNGSLMIHYSKCSQNRPRNCRNYLRKTQLFHSTFQSRLCFRQYVFCFFRWSPCKSRQNFGTPRQIISKFSAYSQNF